MLSAGIEPSSQINLPLHCQTLRDNISMLSTVGSFQQNTGSHQFKLFQKAFNDNNSGP